MRLGLPSLAAVLAGFLQGACSQQDPSDTGDMGLPSNSTSPMTAEASESAAVTGTDTSGNASTTSASTSEASTVGSTTASATSSGMGGASSSSASAVSTGTAMGGASAITATSSTTTGVTSGTTSYCRSFYNSSGGANPCYIGSDGRAHCIVNDGSTVTLSEVPGTIVSVTGWDYTTRACAVNDAGAVYCGDYGSLELWIEAGATQVSGLANGHCAIVDGSVQCESVSVASNVDTGLGSVNVLGCYSDGCCAATDAGRLYCWGDTVETFGVETSDPLEIALPEGKRVLQIGAGQVHTCVLLDGGQVHCWGQDWNGQLGGLGSNMESGIAVVDSGANGVASGQFHTCVAFEDGRVRCAGLAGVHGAGQNSMSLTEVPGVTNAIAVTAGRYASCALLADSSVQCWGDFGAAPAGGNETTVPLGVSGVPVAPCE